MQKFSSVPFQQVDLTDGFWAKRQRLNSDVTLNAVYNQFKNTGRFDAFKFDWKEGMPNKPHIFYDSDVAKWIESAAFILEKEDRPELQRIVDDLVDLIEKNQGDDGYFNVWFTVIEPEMRWQRRTDHELYCAGHMFEAAVAYYVATGKDKFLKLMCKYADYIEKVFKIEHSAAFVTPGHEEIELALTKMFDVTGEKRYLDLSKFFIDERGVHKDEMYYDFANAHYAQDHLPVREQTTAEGHSVRAMYLYCGMADIALYYGDESLLDACRTLFLNTVNRRMYISGGIGSTRYGEAFTVDYDLYNTTAYTESCAALSLALFARRMLKMDPNSLYADVAEQVIYNGFLSSTSLDGKHFFYENPLEIDLDRVGRDKSMADGRGEVLPIRERVEVFSCSCCPPNITRFIASIGDFLYTYDEHRLYVHHYMAGKADWKIGDREIAIEQRTNYPIDGDVALHIRGAKGMKVAVRVPGWCKKYAVELNGMIAEYEIEKGYAMLAVDSDEVDVTLSFDMVPVLMEAHPQVHDDIGKVALMRGPILYCIEAADQTAPLKQLFIDADLNAEVGPNDTYGFPVIKAAGFTRQVKDAEALYQPLGSTYEPTTMNFIPYYAFANRGEMDMKVWVYVK